MGLQAEALQGTSEGKTGTRWKKEINNRKIEMSEKERGRKAETCDACGGRSSIEGASAVRNRSTREGNVQKLGMEPGLNKYYSSERGVRNL